ncbi:hypothetical protein [Nitrosopumilus sp.]|uniref:hypothetical protein n=1 Tax=Nitrosopumilus sp. TaxID=2024843 RepID=UPI00349FDE91
MNKKIILIPIIAIIIIIFASFASDNSDEQKNTVFHVMLADSSIYGNGVYTETFTLNKGEYFFRFVPNGSSPEILSITLNGETFDFSENFQLVGTPHQTGISEYFTWEYDGQKNILISEMQEISITIDPNGETLGSVSVYILEN